MVTQLIALTKSHVYTPKALKLNIFTWQHGRNTCPSSGGSKYKQYKGKKLLALRILENCKSVIRRVLGNSLMWGHSTTTTRQISYCVPALERAVTCTFPLIASAKTKQTQIRLALSPLQEPPDFAPKQAHMNDWHSISSGALAAVQPVQPLHLLTPEVCLHLWCMKCTGYGGEQKLQLQF